MADSSGRYSHIFWHTHNISLIKEIKRGKIKSCMSLSLPNTIHILALFIHQENNCLLMILHETNKEKNCVSGLSVDSKF